jgi:glucan phosphoethanolaminetransferase (alkaline phosphatase superfamily)
MWDRIVNAVYEFVRSLSNTTFIIIAAVLITLGFLFIGNFLKANKKEAPKVLKPSQLLWSVIVLVLFVMLINIRY